MLNFKFYVQVCFMHAYYASYNFYFFDFCIPNSFQLLLFHMKASWAWWNSDFSAYVGVNCSEKQCSTFSTCSVLFQTFSWSKLPGFCSQTLSLSIIFEVNPILISNKMRLFFIPWIKTEENCQLNLHCFVFFSFLPIQFNQYRKTCKIGKIQQL
jgi:hypothetical protein